MKPSESPGFDEMVRELRNAKDTRPRYLPTGWHELEIDRCRRFYRELGGHLFVVEGTVLRSTVPDFVGERWAYVCSLKWKRVFAIMEQIVRSSGNLDVARIANEAQLCSRYECVWPETHAVINPPVTVLADVFEKKVKIRPGTILCATFAEVLHG